MPIVVKAMDPVVTIPVTTAKLILDSCKKIVM
jgi:hypothetical protein